MDKTDLNEYLEYANGGDIHENIRSVFENKDEFKLNGVKYKCVSSAFDLINQENHAEYVFEGSNGKYFETSFYCDSDGSPIENMGGIKIKEVFPTKVEKIVFLDANELKLAQKTNSDSVKMKI